jgi:uncharacterized membrane protein YqhA
LLQFQPQVTFILVPLLFTVVALVKYKLYSSKVSLHRSNSKARRNRLSKQSDEMSRKLSTVIVLVLAVLTWTTETAGQEGLEAKLAGAKLPTTLYRCSAVYDGIDNVYIFGG